MGEGGPLRKGSRRILATYIQNLRHDALLLIVAPPTWIRRLGWLDFYCYGNRIQDRECCLILIGQVAGKQLQSLNGAIQKYLPVRDGQKLEDQSTLEQVLNKDTVILYL